MSHVSKHTDRRVPTLRTAYMILYCITNSYLSLANYTRTRWQELFSNLKHKIAGILLFLLYCRMLLYNASTGTSFRPPDWLLASYFVLLSRWPLSIARVLSPVNGYRILPIYYYINAKLVYCIDDYTNIYILHTISRRSKHNFFIYLISVRKH